jgi:hypothetical protein
VAVPSAYTAEELAAFIVAELGDVGTALGWNPHTSQVAEAVNDVGLILQVDDVVDAPDVRAVRANARIVGWRAAAKAVAAQYTFSEENGVKYDRSDLQKMVIAALGIAEAEAATLLTDDSSVGLGVKMGTMTVYDPYSPAVS